MDADRSAMAYAPPEPGMARAEEDSNIATLRMWQEAHKPQEDKP